MRSIRRAMRAAGVGLGGLCVAIAAPGIRAQAPAPLQTQAEQSGFTEYTSHENMWTYLQGLQARSTEMRLGTYGETHEGRKLPYMIFSRPTVTQPWEAWALGKPIVVLAANVHGGERTLRESVLLLTRELTDPAAEANRLLDDLVIIVVPQINPDGFEADPNPTRGNLWGLDLNRDYMKLEQPEIQAYVQNVILKWAPHLYIDGHNGGSFPYNLNYQCPSHGAPDQRITLLCDKEIFPAINRRLEAEGMRAWYYTGGNATEWRVGGTEARIGRNYGGFANTVGILFESPGGQPMATGVRAGLLGYKAVVEWARTNRQTLVDTVTRARRETIVMGEKPGDQIAVRVRYEAEDYPVDYLIGVGQGADRTIQEVKGARLLKKPVPTITRARPYAYILPRDATDAVALLRRHGITVETLQQQTPLKVQAYVIGNVTHSPVYNHAATVQIEVKDVIEVDRTFPVGTYIVRTAQMQGRVAAHLLEAESDDGVIYWNRMDAWIPRPGTTPAATDPDDEQPPAARGRGAGGGRGGAGGGRGGGRGGQAGPPVVPIFKLMTPTALPLRISQ
ncbi:MAG TPA: M14 family zinc carboxypeptidase [Vicinamibacterales bacterium]|nr:M14 family zinc carboxypeptidase [Vicinamibacterales bacterium]